jgi:hypothetical protein
LIASKGVVNMITVGGTAGGYLKLDSGQITVVYGIGTPDEQKIDRLMLKELLESDKGSDVLVGYTITKGKSGQTEWVLISKGERSVSVLLDRLRKALR